MERSNNYRLLKVIEILFNETDNSHELSMNDLKEKLKTISPDLSVDNRTIKQYFEVLDYVGFDIIKNVGKFGKVYYSHQGRMFEVYQLRLIVDAILSAKFITENEKSLLIGKVKMLTSKHHAETLPSPVVLSKSSSIDYKLVKLNIDRVHQAITNRKILTYQYGKFNINKEFTFNREGMVYEVEPYALIWQNDYYYLIGRFLLTDEMRHYRIDRMRNVEVSDESFKKGDFQLDGYLEQSFHMFAGEEMRMKIRFVNDLINVVLDRFGLDAAIKQDGEDHFILSTKANYSDGLVNWILTWGNKAKVISPSYLVQQMSDKIAEMNHIYE